MLTFAGSSSKDPPLELRLLRGQRRRSFRELRVHCADPHHSLPGHAEAGADVQPRCWGARSSVVAAGRWL
uniref:Uncharacterized protein n=1 Tax=Tanacetum cinerariifolium TaxID=118510 RepID=A0A699WXY7_TANCI|nr:hypothetical protein [Tanacetum cinerariifolium]